ncbi:metallophosphoesterase [Chengkuizengella axinellae]|uniref:Metallophosphoesterase n=1 Tax=Chengkuizengella axinellae TaxID=3064388 RepID=A0ABT9IXY8_9BACL|nr:metallophosphoesterase [Chengkuizengella sp. 2205SS18-9]MDP5274225.1 metallophosphoesterase [Chengkuizengella sp. 2205SS18-9]
MLIWNILFVSILVIIVYTTIHTHYIKVSSHKIHLGLPQPMTVVQLSDIHGKTSFINGKISKIVNSIRPDLILITGDLASTSKHLPKVLKELKQLTSPNVYFVPGNYEREQRRGLKKKILTDNEYLENVNAIRSIGKYLENSGVKVTVNNSSVSIYGFDNSIYGLEKEDRSFLKNSDTVNILLAHSPSIIHFIKEHNIPYHLLLTGHTHGGQIRLFDKSIGPYKDFHVGMKKIKPQSYFYINRGIGFVKLPIRINCSPEITVIRFD